MARILIAVLVLAAWPAAAQSTLERLEQWLDRQAAKEFEQAKRDQLRTLATSRDATARLEAAKSLLHHRDPLIVEALGVALSDPEPLVRITIARGLWRLEKSAEPARPHLTKALEDSDPNVVAQAAGALQASGTPAKALVEARKRVFDAPHATLESRFLVSRGLIGEEPGPRLLETTLAYMEKGGSAHNVELAEKALERLVKVSQDRSLIAPLQEALAGPRPLPVLKALAELEPKPEGWVELLAAQLDSRDAKVRYQALWLLGRTGEPASGALARVAMALDDPDKSVRRSAARALGEIADEKARPALTKALQDAEADVRQEAKEAIARLDRAPEERLWRYQNAILRNHPGDVKRSLEQGMKPVISFGPNACRANQRPTSEETKAILRMMIERGADPNAAAEHGMTPLMDAARYGCDREVMRMLIKAGARIDAKSNTGLTAFEHGLWFGHDGLEELITAGYRLPPDKVKMYTEGYKDRPPALAMIRKATRK